MDIFYSWKLIENSFNMILRTALWSSNIFERFGTSYRLHFKTACKQPSSKPFVCRGGICRPLQTPHHELGERRWRTRGWRFTSVINEGVHSKYLSTHSWRCRCEWNQNISNSGVNDGQGWKVWRASSKNDAVWKSQMVIDMQCNQSILPSQLYCWYSDWLLRPLDIFYMSR